MAETQSKALEEKEKKEEPAKEADGESRAPAGLLAAQGRILPVLCFPLLLCYCEILLKISIGAPFRLPGFLLVLMSAAGFGLLAGLLCFFVPEGTKRHIVRGALMVLLAMPYLVAFFVYLQFKVMFDLNTILFSAKDALTGFTGEAMHMVGSPTGILYLVLFLAPAAAYALFHILRHRRRGQDEAEENTEETNAGKRKALAEEAAEEAPEEAGGLKHPRAAIALAAAFLMLLPVILIRSSATMRLPYRDNYNYEKVVREFGLLTGLRREIVRAATGADKQASFTLAKEPEEEALTPVSEEKPDRAEPETPDDSPAAIVYEPNVMDIDFAALSENAPWAFANIDSYVSSQKPSKKSEYTGLFRGKNLIFITAESFSGHIIDEKLTPTLYRMQTRGIHFKDFYQTSSASTTGGEVELILGILPMAGGASMDIAANYHNYMTIGSFLTREGYFGKMFHNGDNTYYNRDNTHNKLGWSEPYMAFGSGLEQLIEWSTYVRSDVELIDKTFPLYGNEAPFSIYYMTYSGHLPYWRGGNAFAEKHYERVKDLEYSELVKNYIAANLEIEDALTLLLKRLEEAGIADDTVIVMCPDHFPYGLHAGDNYYQRNLEELYGHPVTNDLERDESCLIIWTPSLEEDEPIVVEDPVSSIDVLPTLLNLYGCEFDSRLLPGRDVLSDTEPLVFNISYDWKTDKGTYIAATGVFTPAEGVDPEKLPENYIEQHRQIVANKIEYCRSLTYNDYFYHLFGDAYPGTEQPAKGEDQP